MKIDEVLLNNQSLLYVHEKDELIIQLPSPSIAGAEIQISIQYHGMPFDGLRIGATKFGDRIFFKENWPNRTVIGYLRLIIPTIKQHLSLF